MSERPADPAELKPDAPQGSVFGNLPDSRPGGRSPRRDAATKPRKATAKRASKAAPKPRTPAQPRTAAIPARPASPPRTTTPPRPDDAERESGAGIEDIAWAGVATIAEAATVGVRLLNKTLDALRGSSEKS
jgi:hypothetical protein